MGESNVNLACLIGSRICHDLISPIGAVSNGIELMGMTAAPSEELVLIRDSISSADARIRLFRIAFGTAGAGARISGSEVQAVLAAIYNGGKLAVSWSDDGDCARTEVKLALLLVMCAESTLPWGGTIRITHEDQTWRMRAEADRMRLLPEVWDVISNPSAPAEISPSVVQFALAAATAGELERPVRVSLSDDLILAEF